MMDEEYSTSPQISVIDVYELASAIGKEFEKIIDSCGAEMVTNLMPRVINALEYLEALATKSERENSVVEDLKNRVVKLEYDKHVRAEDRLKFEKELEQIEEEWRKESSHLLNAIAKLQEENKRLNSIISDKSNYEQDDSWCAELDYSILNQLQNQAEQLREKIKQQNNELNDKNNELEDLQNQIEQLKLTVVDLRRKQRLHNSQINGFIDERTNLLIEIQDHRRELHLLRQRLGSVERENEDLMNSTVEVHNLKNKIVHDANDPDRPRFTTSELKEILYERNELKAKVNELQDELAVYRTDAGSSADPQGEDENFATKFDVRRRGCADVYLALRFPDCAPKKGECLQHLDSSYSPSNVINSNAECESATEFGYHGEEELPVEGPLPPEPDDAPWKRRNSESGIRKLFRKILTINR